MALTKVTSNVLADDAVTTGKILDLNVTVGKLADDSVITSKILDSNITSAKLGADSVITSKILDYNITSAKIASNVVDISKVGNEFKTISSLTPSAVVDFSFGTTNGASVFTINPSINTTLNFTNVVPGINKYIILTGSGSSYTLGFTVGGGAGTFNKISGAYNDASGMKNLLQILCVGNSEFWYSISQIDT